jgi:hypothetical protein
MAAPMLLNLRVILEKGNLEPGKVVNIALNNFGANESGVLFQAEYDTKQTARWGCLPLQINGGPLSYFGGMNEQMDMLTKLSEDFPLSDAEMMNNVIKGKITSISSALSYLLNEWFDDQKERHSAVEPNELLNTVAEQVFILSVDYSTVPGQYTCVLIPANLNQSDVSLMLANASDTFNTGIPAYIIEGNNVEGEISDVKAYFSKTNINAH